MTTRHGRLSALGLFALCAAVNCGGSVTHSGEDDTSGSGDNGSDDTASANGSNGNGSNGNGSNGSNGSGASGSSASGGTSGSTGSTGATGSTGPTGSTGSTGSTGGTGGTGATSGFGGASGFTTVGVTGGFGVVTTGGPITTGTTGGPAPDNCEPVFGENSTEYCYMEFQCDGHYASSDCWLNPERGWECGCGASLDNYWRNYSITGLQGGNACSVAAEICLSDDIDFGPKSCMPRFQEQSGEFCSAEEQCSRSASLEGGVEVQVHEYHYAYCDGYQGDGWRCECQGERRSMTLEFPGGGSSMLCVGALDWCDGEGIERIGTPVCRQSYQQADVEYCNAELRCDQQVLANDLEGNLQEWIQINCRPKAEGLWACACGPAGEFEVESDNAWDACGQAAPTCGLNSQ